MTSRPRTLRRGVTLLELLAAMAVLAIVAAIAAMALGVDWDPSAGDRDGLREAVHQAKRRAIATGSPVTIEWSFTPVMGSMPEQRSFTAFPDGSVAGEKELGIALLTGEIPEPATRVAP